MKYPINVDSRVKNAGKSSSKDKTMAFILFSFIINLFIYYVLSKYLTQSLGIPTWIILVIQTIVYIIVCVTVIRVFIIKEDSKMKEYENSIDSGLKKFYKLRDKEEFNRIDDVNIFEYTDGQYLLALSFKYGVNNDKRIEFTKALYKRFFNELGAKDFEFRTYNTTERFVESRECQNMMDTIAKVKHSNLSSAMFDIAEGILDYSESHSDLFETIVFIRTKKAWQFQTLSSIITSLLDDLVKYETSIRYLQFMDKGHIREFIRTYHQVESLDLANLKYAEVDTNLILKYKGVISEYSDPKLVTGGVKFD